MKKRNTFIVSIIILLSIKSYSMSNQDSIYLDLSNFLIAQGEMNEDLKYFGEKFIDVFEITSKENTTDFTSYSFGIFKF